MPASNLLHDRLVEAGFPEGLVRASLPAWWTAEEEGSSSAQTLVSLLLARRLGLDPASLLDDGVPLGFLHAGPTKFKHLRLGSGWRRDSLTAFGQGVSRIVLAAYGEDAVPLTHTAAELRAAILQSGSDHVSFGDVLTLCWSVGVPVLHLRLFPAKTKGVTAMAVRIGARHVILVARESGVAAQYMFHVAHELGHIALGHLENAATIVDADPLDAENEGDLLGEDDEEIAADCFAQELLTGMGHFSVSRMSAEGSLLGTPQELAARALQVGKEMRIDPGHVVMCFGQSTGEWALAQAAAKHIPSQTEGPGTLVNKVFWDQLGQLTEDQSLSFLKAVAAV